MEIQKDYIEKFEKNLPYVIKILLTTLGVLVLLSIIGVESNKKSPREIAQALDNKRKMFEAFKAGKPYQANENLPDIWPPKMNESYPDIDLIDQTGKRFMLSSLKGKVIIIEYIDMSSPISQAQSGAGLLGAYNATPNQDIDKYAMPISYLLNRETSGAFSLPHKDIIEVKIIIYGGDGGGAGTRSDAMNWAHHFNFTKDNNVFVAVPVKDMRSKESDNVLTGYQLIDKNMILRVDSASTTPKHNIKMTLIPLVPKLLR